MEDLRRLAPSAKLSVSNLPIGDVLIRTGDEAGSVNPSDVLLAVERKTVPDLLSSILDGRYKEQQVRLREAFPGKHMYVIEGFLEKRMNKTTFFGAIISLACRQGIPVIMTQNTEDTARFLLRLATRLEKEPDMLTRSTPAGGPGTVPDEAYCESLVQKFKKQRLTSQDRLAAQLSIITGVSGKMAQAIAQKYSSLKALSAAFQESAVPEKMLQDIRWEGSSRRLGPALAKKIFHAWQGEEC